MSDDEEREARVQAEIEREQRAAELFKNFVETNADELKLIARWGDGECGYMLSVLQERLGVKS